MAIDNSNLFKRTEADLTLDRLVGVIESIEARNGELYGEQPSYIKRKLQPGLFSKAYRLVSYLAVNGFNGAHNRELVQEIIHEYVFSKLVKSGDEVPSYMLRMGFGFDSLSLFRGISAIEDGCLDLALSVPREWWKGDYHFTDVTIRSEMPNYPELEDRMERMTLAMIPDYLQRHYPAIHGFFSEQKFDSNDPIVIVEMPSFKRPKPLDPGLNAEGVVVDGKKRLIAMAVQGHSHVSNAYVGKENYSLERMEYTVKNLAKAFFGSI